MNQGEIVLPLSHLLTTFYDTKVVVSCCDLCITAPIFPSVAGVIFLLVIQEKGVILDHQNNLKNNFLVKMLFKEYLNIFNSLVHGQ